MEATETTLASMSSQGSKKGNKVLGIKILRGVLQLKEVDLSPRRALEVRCSVLRRIVLRVSELTVETADKAEMPALVVVRLDIWSKTDNRTEVRPEVMLSLGLTHRVKQQPSLQRGTNSMPRSVGRSRRSPLM